MVSGTASGRRLEHGAPILETLTALAIHHDIALRRIAVPIICHLGSELCISSESTPFITSQSITEVEYGFR